MLYRFRRTDEGSVAVLAGITFPVVLLAVALAMAAYVWTASEHETQRASDTAAVRAAATAFLGTDYPYEDVPPVTSPASYPSVGSIAALAGKTPPADVTPCGTVGLTPVADQVPSSVTLPNDCSGVGPYAVPPALGLPDASVQVACDTATAAMAPGTATYANRFYSGGDASQPSCHHDASTGTKRIGVDVATGSPFIGFGQYATDQATGALDTQVAPQVTSVQQVLAAYGIHLDTSLPSLICPEVSVTVDQPVREPVFDRAAQPNGRASARRVVKNAVVVPVYQGRTIEPVPGDVVSTAAGVGVDVLHGARSIHVDPVNLNALLLAAQQQMLTLLDEVDAIADAAIRAANVTVDQLNGVYRGIDPSVPQPPPTPGTGPLQSLEITRCLRNTMTQIYDPPSGDAPTSDEVLAQAAANGEEVIAIQVGVVSAACTEPGAIDLAPDISTPTPNDDCVRAATTPRVDPTTGIYEVPFFDATPVLVQDVGDHNYETVPVHASQASGAFRGALVRDHADERYDPDTTQPLPTFACQVTIPAPTPTTACAILSATPSPSVSLPVTLPPTPTLPSSTPTLPSSTPTPTLPPVTPTPIVTLAPSPTRSPTPTCLVLCGHL